LCLVSVILVLGALLAVIVPAPAAAEDQPPRVPRVWFGPAQHSADFLKLFTEPAAWGRTRDRVNALLFSPLAVDGSAAGEPNSLAALTQVDAFRKLKDWGIATAIEAPAVKEWDCTGRKAAAVTEQMIGHVVDAGGLVGVLSLDEPLVSGLGRNQPICHLSIAEIAANMADYARAVRASAPVVAQGAAPEFGD